MMKVSASTSPMTHREVIDRYFLEHRAKLIDIAAFLDRVERAHAAPEERSDEGAGIRSNEDFRVVALRQAAAILLDGQPDRARRILESLSDPTVEPIDRAHTKGAAGAYEIQKEHGV